MSGAEERRRRVKTLRAEQARRQAAAARRRRFALIAAPIAVVVLVIAVMAGVKLTGTSTTGGTLSAASESTLAKVTGVPAETLAKAGAPPPDAKVLPVSGEPPLMQDGKPRIFYLGAEYCPYCAAERWPLIVALSRFGTFTGLGESRSTSDDVFPNTATFTFRSATYSSPYVAFTAVETEDSQGRPLQQPDTADAALVTKLNGPPYVPAEAKGSIPFIDIGNQFLITGASYSPDVLKGLDNEQIADKLADPTGSIGKPVDSVANLMTASICAITGDKPANVCNEPVVKNIRKGLG
ncbi:DUF929 family protein [Streptosporangium lutulentum]|uniref:Thiol-disulfide isomerase/thioredoxin n=1 Tax=Streptosporangium lutulentum TaxID=1461250 RepID=A0ABT9Q805_9ACTN|nr:DUF929 family protein [Streptosporangium lutulentum]MDP9842797.1 thiol-disulfide isomerase/thioredoxin [Streptosporangium lutulentum]